MTLAVPFFTYWLAFACDEHRCPEWPLNRFKAWHVDGWHSLVHDGAWRSLWSNQAALVYLYWYLWTVVCWAVLPGSWVTGGELRDGGRVWYRMNGQSTHAPPTPGGRVERGADACPARAGFASLLASLAVVAGVTYTRGVEPLLYISDHWAELISASLAMSFAQACLVHAMSYRKGAMLALGGNTGNELYNVRHCAPLE